MKINGKITLLINNDRTEIEFMDDDSNLTFARAVLTPEQLSQVLGRLSHVSCDMEVFALDRVGKKMEMQTHEFEIPNLDYNHRSEKLSEIIKETLPEGWISDNYFGSQNTFFTKDGKKYARTTIRRWVDKD